jgi:hypothetical protein
MDLTINALVQSPLYRNLSTIPADLHTVTHHISQQCFPFSYSKVEEDPQTSGLGDDSQYRFRLSQFGYAKTMTLKLEYRIYPWSRTQVTSPFGIFQRIDQIELRTHNRPIQTIYGSEIMLKTAYFTRPEEAVAKLDQACNQPIEINNYQEFSQLFDRYLLSSSSDTVVTDDQRGNSQDKYIKNFEPFNPGTWGSPSDTPTDTYYGVVTLYVDIPFACTQNLHVNFDTRFVEHLDVIVKFQSEDNGEPLYQAWGVMDLFPGNGGTGDALSVPTATTSTLLPDAPVEGAANLNIYNTHYAPTDSDSFGDGLNVGEYSAYCPHVPYVMSVGASNLDLANYKYAAGGVRLDGTTGYESTTITAANDVLCTFKDWVLAHYYMAFPWLVVTSSSLATTWGAFDALSAGGDWGTGGNAWPSTITTEGGSSLATLGVPDKGNFKPTLVVDYWNPHDSVREQISSDNYKDDEPATLLMYDTQIEYSNELYGTSAADKAVGETLSLDIRSNNLAYAIAVVAKENNDDVALNWGDIHAMRDEFDRNNLGLLYDATEGSVTVANAGLDSSKTDIGYRLELEGNEGKFMSPTKLSHISETAAVIENNHGAVAFSSSHIPRLAYKAVQNCKTVLPTYAALKASGRTIWDNTQGATASMSDMVRKPGRGNPVAEFYQRQFNVDYNVLEQCGKLTNPRKLPEVIDYSGVYKQGDLTKQCFGRTSDYLDAVIIDMSFNPTDQLSCSGAISLQALNAPKLELIYDRPVRLDVLVFHYVLIQIDSDTGTINRGIDI